MTLSLRTASILIAAMALGAAELEWAGGELSLAEACTLLDQSGYPTTSAHDLAPGRRAEVPMIAGGYWDAALTIGRAFNCIPAPPETSHRFSATSGPQPGLTAEVDAGPVVLAAADGLAPAFSAHGPLLVEVIDAGIAERRTEDQRQLSAGILLQLRLSPDLDPATLGPAHLVLGSIVAADGTRLAWHPQAPTATGDRLPRREVGGRRGDPVAVVVPELPRRTSLLRLTGELVVQRLQHQHLQRQLRPGQRMPIPLAGEAGQLDLWLYAAEDAAETPWQRPGVGIGFPPGALPGTEPEVTVASLTGERLRDFGQRSMGRDPLLVYTYLHQVEDGPYQVTVDVDLRAGELRLPFQLDVPLPEPD